MPTKAELETQVENLRHDLETVTTNLREEATRRGWCSDFETFADKVNEDLRTMTLTRSTDVLAKVTVSLTFNRVPLSVFDATSAGVDRALNDMSLDNLFEAVGFVGQSQSDLDCYGGSSIDVEYSGEVI